MAEQTPSPKPKPKSATQPRSISTPPTGATTVCSAVCYRDKDFVSFTSKDKKNLAVAIEQYCKWQAHDQDDQAPAPPSLLVIKDFKGSFEILVNSILAAASRHIPVPDGHYFKYLVVLVKTTVSMVPISCGCSAEHSAGVLSVASVARDWCIGNANRIVSTNCDANQIVGANLGAAPDVAVRPSKNMAGNRSARFIIEVEWKNRYIALTRQLVLMYFGADIGNQLRGVLVIHVTPITFRAVAVLWMRDGDNVPRMIRALDFGAQPLAVNQRTAWADAAQNKIVGVGAAGWVRHVPAGGWPAAGLPNWQIPQGAPMVTIPAASLTHNLNAAGLAALGANPIGDLTLDLGTVLTDMAQD